MLSLKDYRKYAHDVEVRSDSIEKKSIVAQEVIEANKKTIDVQKQALDKDKDIVNLHAISEAGKDDKIKSLEKQVTAGSLKGTFIGIIIGVIGTLLLHK